MQGGVEIAGLPPVIIPVFVSHLGCPQRCLFCDQRQFSKPVAPEEVPALVDGFLSLCRQPRERRRILGFFGGTFTGMDEDLLNGYLEVTGSLIEGGVIHAAKASTRPDMVTRAVLASLLGSGFEELEIGVQSMDDSVLRMSHRGHTALDARRACAFVRESGLRLGIQLMPGLPGEDADSFKRTVDETVALRPDTARIYPTVVMEGTGLEELYRKGVYEPLSLDEALQRALYASIRLEQQGCTILRMGLPQSKDLRIAAGPYHEAFGFLVRAYGYRIMASQVVDRLGQGCTITVNPADLSALLGHRRTTVSEMNFSFSFDAALPRGYIRADAGPESACIQLEDILGYVL